MSDQTDAFGGRLPFADPAALNPAQREIFDRMSTRIVPVLGFAVRRASPHVVERARPRSRYPRGGRRLASRL
jgi:hypothetical protein